MALPVKFNQFSCELEIGQIAGLIHDIKPVAYIVKEMLNEFELAKAEVKNI